MKDLTVVMYHYVRNIKNARYPNIKGLELDDFIQQLEFFGKHYHVVTMEQVLAAKNGEASLPDKAMLLTFDDGYAEHFSHVYPILKKMGMQGSFFVPVKTVLEHQVLDVNKIHFILAASQDVGELINNLKERISYYRKEYELLPFNEYFQEYAVENRFDTKEVIFFKRMLQHVLPESLRNILADEFFQMSIGMSEKAFAKELYMDKYQLEQLVQDGMHVGCHGYNHYWWDKLSPDVLKKEINKSKDFLASLGCDMENWTACYPYGATNDQVVEELAQQGCSLALTTRVDLVDLERDSRFLLPRLDTVDFPPISNNYLKYS